MTHPRRSRAAGACVWITAAALVLTSCAPEDSVQVPSPPEVKPNTIGPINGGTGHTDEEQKKPSGDVQGPGDPSESQGGAREPVEPPKSQELPASFPAQHLELPGTAVIDDAGERNESAWFLVLRTDSIEHANDLVDTIAQSNSLAEVSSETNDDGGRSTELRSDALMLATLTFQNPGEAALVSIEVELR